MYMYVDASESSMYTCEVMYPNTNIGGISTCVCMYVCVHVIREARHKTRDE